MSQASITPQTAPRDPVALKGIGIFQLRTLTERLGALTTEEQKMAYARMNLDEKVMLAVQLLQNFDRQNPGAAQAPQPAPHMNGTNGAAVAAPPMMAAPSVPMMGTVAAMPGQPQMAPPPMVPQQQQIPPAPAFGGFPQQSPQGFAPQQPGFAPQPMQQQPMFNAPPQVAPVDPGALAAAQLAAQASPAEASTGRKPRNSASKAESAVQSDLGEKVLNALTSLATQNQANTDAMTAAVKELTGTIDELRKENIKEQLKGLNEAYAGVYNIMKLWDSRFTMLQQSVNLSIALSLMLAEQVLGGAPRDQVLQIGMGDAGSIGNIIQQALQPQATPGKA